MDQPAQIQEKAPKPQGLLPKNVQSWLFVGLASLMVAIMWLTGGKKPSAPAKTAMLAPPTQVPLEVNETKINELQSRIEELQREQLVAQSALAQQTRLISNSPEDSPSQPGSAPGATGDQKPVDPEQAERKRRAYVSLFASNVALTIERRRRLRRRRNRAPTPSTPEPCARRTRTSRGRATRQGDAAGCGARCTRCSFAGRGFKRFYGNKP